MNDMLFLWLPFDRCIIHRTDSRGRCSEEVHCNRIIDAIWSPDRVECWTTAQTYSQVRCALIHITYVGCIRMCFVRDLPHNFFVITCVRVIDIDNARNVVAFAGTANSLGGLGTVTRVYGKPDDDTAAERSSSIRQWCKSTWRPMCINRVEHSAYNKKTYLHMSDVRNLNSESTTH